MALSAIAVVGRISAWTSSSSLNSPVSNFNSISRFISTVSVAAHHRRHHRSFIRMASTAPSPPDGKLTAPYGSWKSPITADAISSGEKRLGGISVDGSGRLILLESRPAESGRSVLVREAEKPGDERIDITPKGFSVRTKTQEYGGGAFCVTGDTVIFSNYTDQRLYKQSLDSADPPVPITADYNGLVTYADGVFDARFNRYITVREDSRKSSLTPETTIVAIDVSNSDIKEPKMLISGYDFYAFPRLDAKGERMTWIGWNHPNMPWDRTELWVGYISENGDIHKRVCVAGGSSDLAEAPTEPKWSSSGELFFVTDRKNGFWNLYKWLEPNNENKAITRVSLDVELLALHTLEAEFSRPLWVFGTNSYEVILYQGQTLIACSYRQQGRSYVGILNPVDSSLSLLDIPFTDINNITLGSNCLFIEGASGVQPSSVAKVTLDENKTKAVDFQIVWSSSPDSSSYKSYFSLPEFFEFPTGVPGQVAYAYFYPPSNPNYRASPEEKPPLLLKSHGGPTAEARGILNLSIQYWTSRGWGFVDVNYGGSTGFGREYRERLLGTWGDIDVNDCCNCAKFLAENGKVDGERLCITGGSAGGFTTLAALAFKNTFKAGASLYGVADLTALRADTHKFESHYIDNLVGSEKNYFERSPINFVERFSCPIILFQGLEDKVVLPDQARKIYRALKEKGLPVALVEYKGEQHGFRKAENIKFTLEQQMAFFARLVGKFEVADDITPIKVDNFD